MEANRAGSGQNQPENSLLQAAAECATVLLSDEDFDRAVNQALEILATSLGLDRLGINEHHEDPTSQSLGYLVVCPYEWLSPYAISQFAHPEMNIIPYDGIEAEYDRLKRGEHWGGLIETFPEPFRSHQRDRLGVKSTYAIPIMVKGQYWGIIGLDFCQIARELTDGEIAVLKTAASCIGSAIQRERNRRAKEEAEKKALLDRQKARELQERDRLLNITANAARSLLKNENLETAIANALQIIGEGIDSDRVSVMEHFEDSTGESLGYLKMLFEWHSPDTVSQLNHPNLQEVGYQGIESWYEKLIRGEAVGGIIDEFPEPLRSGQREIGVKSLYSVPITIDGQYWGIVGFDDCKEAKQRSETEISILKTTAACIGSAIEQSRIRQQREQAQRNILLEQQKAAQLAEHNQILEQRDRLLSATAEASNVLLTGEDFDEAVKRALQIIGESIDTDRVVVAEHFEDPSGQSLGHLEFFYEWHSTYTVSQVEQLKIVSYKGIESFYELFCQGIGFGRAIDETLEPFRSEQKAIGVKSTYSIPIMIEGKFWGLVGIDDCREETNRSAAELSILKTAAACIGGAIEQERIRRAKEEAERNILQEREKAATERAEILQAVATVANSLLRAIDYTTVLPNVLQILGEAAKSDRCGLLQNITDPKTGKAAVKMCAEWCREGISTSIDRTPELETAILWEYFPQLQQMLDRGEIYTFLVDNLLEPARSIFQEQGNVSMTIVPIVVQEEFYGVFGFDYCQEDRLFNEADKAIFAIAVDSIAAAIEREQKDEALRASEKRYRELFEASNDGIHFVEFEPPIPVNLPIEEQIDRLYSSSRFTDGNPGWEKSCGLSRSEMIGKPLTVVHSPDSEGHRSLMRRLIENGWQITNAESEDIDANGKKRYWLSHLFATIENGYAVRAWGLANNITPLKEAQLALLEAEQKRSLELEILNAKLQQALKELGESEKRYRTLFELSNEGIYRFEIDPPIDTSLPIDEQLNLLYQYYRVTEVNNTFLEQFGFRSLSDVIGKGLNDFDPPGSLNWESNRAILQNGYQIRNLELEGLTADNRVRYFLSNIVCNVTDGYVWGGWGMCTDITKLKIAQQNLLEAERQRVAQLEESNQILSLREIWLEATANAANKLLEIADLDAAINAALKILGESLDWDRVGVMQYFEDDTGESLGYVQMLYEWDSAYASPQILHPELNQITWDEEFKEWVIALKTGEFAGANIDELPEPFRSGQIELGVKSTYAAPIFISDRFWGILAIDRCREAKRLTPGEIAVFKTAASCVGSAIYRQQIQQQRERAERTIILEREKAATEKAAELTKVNQILSRSLGKLTDTADLDLFLGEVVLEITRQVDAVCGHIFLYDADDRTLQQLLSVRHGIIYQGAAEHDCELFHSPFPADITPAFQYVLEKGEIILLSTSETLGLVWPGTSEWHQQMGHQEAAAIALMIGNKPLGLLGLAFAEKSSLKPEKLELIYALTNQASLAIQLTNLAELAQKSALTDERNRMAREIHDTLAQAFTGISLQLEVAQKIAAAKPEAIPEYLNNAGILAREGLNEARRSVRALRPEALETGDLALALRKLIQTTTIGTNITATVEIKGTISNLAKEIENNLLRIAQEAFTNAIRHGLAQNIAIELIFEPDTLQLRVKDDGCGFNIQQIRGDGSGLIGMQERSQLIRGQLTINSQIDCGTEIIVLVPLFRE